MRFYVHPPITPTTEHRWFLDSITWEVLCVTERRFRERAAWLQFIGAPFDYQKEWIEAVADLLPKLLQKYGREPYEITGHAVTEKAREMYAEWRCTAFKGPCPLVKGRACGHCTPELGCLRKIYNADLD